MWRADSASWCSHQARPISLACLCTCCVLACMQLADACSSAEEQQGQVAAARQEVNAVLAGRERRCQELRAEVCAFPGFWCCSIMHAWARQRPASLQQPAWQSTIQCKQQGRVRSSRTAGITAKDLHMHVWHACIKPLVVCAMPWLIATCCSSSVSTSAINSWCSCAGCCCEATAGSQGD